MDWLSIPLLSLLIVGYILLLDLYLVYIISLPFYSFKYIQSQFLQLIAYIMLGFFMDIIPVIVIKGEVFNCILPYSLKFFFNFYALKPFYTFQWLFILNYILIIPGIVSLFSILYISAIFNPFFLLQGLLKYFLLLGSLVQPLVLTLLFIKAFFF